MRPGKRIDLLLKAVSEMKSRHRIRLLLLAGGPTAPYEKMVDHLGLRDIILVKENEAAVEDFVQAADAGLYTSDYESFGLSILETLYFGKPVVAFQVGGIPEVVGKSYRSILFLIHRHSRAPWTNWWTLPSSPRAWANKAVAMCSKHSRPNAIIDQYTRALCIGLQSLGAQAFDCRAGAPPAIL